MLSVKVKEATDTIFEVFGMTQLRIEPNLPCFAGKCSNEAGAITTMKKVLSTVLL